MPPMAGVAAVVPEAAGVAPEPRLQPKFLKARRASRRAFFHSFQTAVTKH